MDTEQKFLKIQVIDTGVGMSEEDSKNLFNLFGKLESSEKMNSQGCGLGLFISKLLINQLGGEISVTSKLGQGTTFEFYIAA